MIDTRTDWLKKLESLSPIIHGYGLSGNLGDANYVTRQAGQLPIFHDQDAFNFCNSDPHNAIIVDTVNVLQRRMADPGIRALLGELTSRKTYGASAR